MNLNYALQSKRGRSCPDFPKAGKSNEPSNFNHSYDLKSFNGGIRSVNVTAENRYLIITFENSDGKILILDLDRLEFLPHKFSDHKESVRLTSISKDNKMFYTASWDGSSRCYDISTGKCNQILSGIGRIPSCFLDPELKYLFTASYDSDIELGSKNTGRCWSISSGERVYLYKHTKERISPECIDIAYDQRYVYTGSDDGTLFKWDLIGGEPKLKYFEINSVVRKIALSERFIAAACTDGLIRVYYKTDGEHFRNFIHSNSEVMEVRIAPDESKLYSASADGSLKCFCLITGDLLFHSNVHSSMIWSMNLSSINKTIITGSHDGSIAFLSADSGQILAKLLIPGGYNDFIFSCPPDRAFVNGLFYTNNTDLIEVKIEDSIKGSAATLDKIDPRRLSYISKLNMKNLIITRLKNYDKYNSFTEEYLKNKEMLSKLTNNKLMRVLKASYD